MIEEQSGKPVVLFAARNLPAEVRRLIFDAFDTVELPADPAMLQTLEARPVALLCTVDVSVDRSLIAALPESVRIIATYSVGLDHIDLGAAEARGLEIVNTPGTLADSVSEIAMFLMIGAARRARESIALIDGGTWSGWRPDQLLGISLVSRRLGVFGMGEIGLAVASRAQAFGMTVHYHNRKESAAAKMRGYSYVANVPAFLAMTDVLLIAAPSTPETRGFVNEEHIAMLPRGAIIVNIARGDLVDDDALIRALENGHVRAAGLDVFANEPDLDPRYRSLPSVLALPHAGSSTLETRLAMGAKLIEGVERALARPA